MKISGPKGLLFMMLALTVMVNAALKLEIINLPEPPETRFIIKIRCPYGTVLSNEKTITRPTEAALKAASGLKNIYSSTGSTSVRFTLQMASKVDKNTSYVEISRIMNSIFKSFPQGTGKPEIILVGSRDRPVFIAAFPNSQNLSSDLIKTEFGRIPGTGEIETGMSTEEIFIKPDRIHLDSESIMKISSELRGWDAVGSIDTDEGQLFFDGRFRSIEDIQNHIMPGGNRLSDSAELSSIEKRPEGITRINGTESQIIYVKESGSRNTARLCRDCLELTEALGGTVVYDYGGRLSLMFKSIIVSAIAGLLLVFFIILLIFRNIRIGIFSCLCIPFSTAAGLAALSFCGLDLDVLSASGLAAGTGIVVDASILAAERTNKAEFNPVFPITASTLTTIIVFVPLLFTVPEIRRSFSGLAVSLSASVTASALYAAAVPLIGSNNVKESRPKIKWTPPGKRASRFFIAVSLAALTVIPFLKFENSCLNSRDSIGFRIHFRKRTALDTAADYISSIEHLIINSDPEGTFISMIKERNADITIFPSSPQAFRSLEKLLSKTAYLNDAFFFYSENQNGSRAENKIILRHNNLKTLFRAADSFAALIKEHIPDAEIILHYSPAGDRFSIELKDEALLPDSISAEAISYQVFNMLNSPVKMKMPIDNGLYRDVRVGRSDWITLDELTNLYLKFSGAGGEAVLLSDVADILHLDTPSVIYHTDGIRSLSISVVSKTTGVRALSGRINKLTGERVLPRGTVITAGHGMSEKKYLFFSSLFWLLEASLLIFLVVLIFFENLKQALSISFRILPAAAFPLLTVLITGGTADLLHIAGIIIAAGLSVNNGIIYSFCGFRKTMRAAAASSLTTCAGALPLMFPSPSESPLTGFALMIIAGSLGAFLTIYMTTTLREDLLK